MKALKILMVSSILMIQLPSDVSAGGNEREDKLKILNQLQLTDQQKKQLKEIKERSFSDRKARRKEMRTFRKKMKSLYRSDASDEELRLVHAQLQIGKISRGNTRFERNLQIRKVLNPEQRKRFGEAMAKRKGKWSRRKSKRAED